jgi:hypothetical protein
VSKHDIDLMQHADGELDSADVKARIEKEPDARAKVESLAQMHEVVRGHLEMSADAIPDRRFDTMWREISRAVDVEQPRGVLSRIRSWFDRHRGHVITGMVSAGAVAALALILRGDTEKEAGGPGAIDVQPAALRPAPVIEDLETPGGNSTVLNIEDDDGHTTVIVVTPADTVEGI